MRYIWMIFSGLLVAMLVVLPRLGQRSPVPTANKTLPAQRVAYSPTSPAPTSRADLAKADSIVAFGLAQRGTPYVWAGTSPLTGFDCSGFILYTFARFGVPIPHSTSLLIDVGRPVARADAQTGDIVVFTGTDKASTTPGHAGIIISHRGELPMRFIHASSSRREPFVKVSQVENSDYERRFMQVRRVLGPSTGMVATARAKMPVTAPAPNLGPTAVVSALPARAVAVAKKAAPAAPMPQVLPKQPVRSRAVARKSVTHRPATKAATRREASAKPAAKSRPTSVKTASAKKKRATRR